MSAIVHCSHLDAGHGGKPVVRDFDLALEPGQVTTLLGPNGAGKTTVMLTIAGLLPCLGGTIEVSGIDVSSRGVATRVRSGVVLVPDDRALFPSLTVKDHLSLARRKGSPPVAAVLEHFPELGARLTARASALSGGEQQMLAIGRALLQQPRVLLIDELSMGLAPIVVERLLAITRSIADATGTSVLLVEQHVFMALALADQAVVLVHGTVELAGSARSMLDAPERLEQAYLATTGDQLAG
jgi:branched-chain amino acid transport system ATP-binding protein